MLKRVVKQRKHSLSLARKSLKNKENIKRKWKTRDILQNKETVKTGGLESPQFILRTILVITFHKLHQQHSERCLNRAAKQKVICISILKSLSS